MPETYIYRTRTTWVYLAVLILIGSLATYGFFVANRFTDAAISAMNTAAFSAILWLFVVGPKVVFTTEGVSIHNPFRTIKIGWLGAVELTTRFSFAVVTDKGTYAAWAAPGSSGLKARRIRRNDFRGTGVNRVLVTPDHRDPRSESDTALALARLHSERAINKGTATDGVKTSTNWASLALLLISAIALLSNLIIH